MSEEKVRQCGDPQCACVTYPMLHSIDDGQTVTLTPNPSVTSLADIMRGPGLPTEPWVRQIRMRREGNRFVIVD